MINNDCVMFDVSDGRGGGGRYEPYPPARYAEVAGYRGSVAPPPDRERQPPRDDFASEQVKDLLELYFRDPYAFDQYAKTYYYGERAERERTRVYYERRPTDVYEHFLFYTNLALFDFTAYNP